MNFHLIVIKTVRIVLNFFICRMIKIKRSFKQDGSVEKIEKFPENLNLCLMASFVQNRSLFYLTCIISLLDGSTDPDSYCVFSEI